MNKGAYYTEREQYIRALEVVLQPVQDFNRLRYVNEFYADTAFIQLSNILGDTIFIDITAKSMEEIFKEVARAINGQTPYGLVKDLEQRRHIAGLFQKVA